MMEELEVLISSEERGHRRDIETEESAAYRAKGSEHWTGSAARPANVNGDMDGLPTVDVVDTIHPDQQIALGGSTGKRLENPPRRPAGCLLYSTRNPLHLPPSPFHPLPGAAADATLVHANCQWPAGKMWADAKCGNAEARDGEEGRVQPESGERGLVRHGGVSGIHEATRLFLG
jgi:hypothetical protein